jgi:hypothetical protein
MKILKLIATMVTVVLMVGLIVHWVTPDKTTPTDPVNYTTLPHDSKATVSVKEGNIVAVAVQIKPSNCMFFGDTTGKNKLCWDQGIMTFEGNATASAKLFFDSLKHLGVDVCRKVD